MNHINERTLTVFNECITKCQECIEIGEEVINSCISKQKPLEHCMQAEGKCTINFDILIACCEKCIDECNLHKQQCSQEACIKLCNKVIFVLRECISMSEECMIHCEENDFQISVEKCKDFIKKGKECIDACKMYMEFMSSK